MKNELSISTLPDFLPTTFKEAEIFAEMFAKSNLCPKDYKSKPDDILIAMQMGARLKLDPFQSVQGIAVINGRSCVWGDAALAIVRSHPHCLGIREWIEGSIKSGNAIAYCEIERKGQEKQVRSFSIQQAVVSNLLGKAGPWTQYPERMLAMRARGFALRDVFADALKGFSVAEEVRDYEQLHDIDEPKEHPKLGVQAVKQAVAHLAGKTPKVEPIRTGEKIIDHETDKALDNANVAPSFNEVKKQMENAKIVDDLILVVDVARSLSLPKDQRDELAKIYKKKKIEVIKE